MSTLSVIAIGVETALVVLAAFPTIVFNLRGNADEHERTPRPALEFLAFYAHALLLWPTLVYAELVLEVFDNVDFLPVLVEECENDGIVGMAVTYEVDLGVTVVDDNEVDIVFLADRKVLGVVSGTPTVELVAVATGFYLFGHDSSPFGGHSLNIRNSQPHVKGVVKFRFKIFWIPQAVNPFLQVIEPHNEPARSLRVVTHEDTVHVLARCGRQDGVDDAHVLELDHRLASAVLLGVRDIHQGKVFLQLLHAS